MELINFDVVIDIFFLNPFNIFTCGIFHMGISQQIKLNALFNNKRAWRNVFFLHVRMLVFNCLQFFYSIFKLFLYFFPYVIRIFHDEQQIASLSNLTPFHETFEAQILLDIFSPKQP